MAGYKILEDNSKKSRILQQEGVCPTCSHYPSFYRDKIETYNGKRARQFVYRCPKCDTRWQGNYFDTNLNLI